jgi:hypothetical protein
MYNKKRIGQTLLAVVVLTLVMGQGCPILPVNPIDSLELTEQAAQTVQQEDSDAIIFEVGGVNGSSVLWWGSQTLTYEFLAVNPDDPGTIWILSYDVITATWTIEQEDEPFVGVTFADMSEVQMSETEARALLASAGHEDDFLNWSLYQPLHPDFPNPLYTFVYNDKSVTIDTQTEAVTVSVFGQEPPLGGTQPGDDSVSLEYVTQADSRIKQENSEAIIVWAGGRDGDGDALNEPADTNLWDFLAILPESGPGLTAWTMTYDGEWTIEDFNGVPWGVEFIDMTTVNMDVVEAWQLATDAGYDPPFEDWTLFKSLNPNVENPNFVFTTNAGFVIVDTVTGDVSLE